MTIFLRGAGEIGPPQTRDSQLTGKMCGAEKESTGVTAAVWRRLSLGFVKRSYAHLLTLTAQTSLSVVLCQLPGFQRGFLKACRAS